MKRAKHSLTNYKLASFNQGQLIPCGLTEVLPGDSFQHSTSALLRIAPLATPVMHPVHVRIHHFFVPHRLVWDDWENFITGGPDGLNASVFPTITVNTGTGWAVGSLADYLGVPTGVDDQPVSALPFRAYAMVFNEYFRDQDLLSPLVIDKTDGADTTTSTVLQNVAWEKDYFTTSRPWTQKGPQVTLPLGDTADVVSNGDIINVSGGVGSGITNNAFTINAANKTVEIQNQSANANTLFFGADTGLEVDLSTATAVDINQVRLAFALQRYEEARARYGSRYTEYLRYLGIKSSDARLQRPEYLGGGKQTIQFSEVLQTNAVTGAGVGEMFGHGIAAMRTNRYRRFFEEHGYVISLCSVQPRTMYVQGLPRTWSRTTKEEFFQKELQHIGQQEVLNKEIYLAHSAPNGTFGFQDRYDEYRRQENTVAGAFRSTLSDWHMARIFTADPALNNTFVTSNPTTRVYQSVSDPQIYAMFNHNIQARRLVDSRGSSYIL